MPIEIVSNVRTIKDISEAEGLYLKSKMYKGQILLYEQVDSQDNLKIFNSYITTRNS